MSIFFKTKSKKNTKTKDILSGVLPEMLPTYDSAFVEFATGKRLATASQPNPANIQAQKNNQKQKASQGQSHKKSPRPSWFKRTIGLPAYHWVLLSQVVVLLPHLAYLPFWLVVYGLFSIVMQLPSVKAKFAKRQRLTSWYRFIQLVGFLLGLVGLWLTYRGFGVDAGVAFLLLCLVGKLWELYQRRDAFVVLNLSLFVCASLFLLDQGLTSSLQVLIAVLAVLMAFVAMNDDVEPVQTSDVFRSEGAGRVRSVAMLAGLAVPLLVVLFLFFPRLPPLWSMQLSSAQAKTGVSDSMSPGDFSNLSQSTELAFRVEFTGEKPALSDMYWRGLVFNNFDGVTWTANRAGAFPWIEGSQPQWVQRAEQSSQQPEQRYQVILEPTNQQWLFALDYPFQIAKDIGLTTEFTLGSFQPVVQQKRYQSSYKADMRINQRLSEHERTLNLQLPKTGNTQAKELAKKLYNEAGSTDAYIRSIAQWINQGNFRYTLSPPKLSDNRIDEFLFSTQAGFCEHYSSSFTFLMRAVGIPARVVVGYQGGQLGRDGSSWEIRQMDAHAWTEVWLEGQGWTRIDPTSWVAPERVEQGMDALSTAQGASLFGEGAFAELSYQQFKMLQEIRRLSDQMSYYWDRDIVGFDNDKQSQSLLNWFNIESVYQQVMIMFSTFAMIIGLILLWLWWKRRQQWHIADRELIKLSKALSKRNVDLIRAEEEGMLAWIERMEAFGLTDLEQLNNIKSSYRKLRYGRLSDQGITANGKMTTEYQAELDKLNKAVQKMMNKL